MPLWKDLAKKLTKSNLGFERLAAPQLIKHALGLKFGRRAQDVRLVYFYFEAGGRENGEHLDEIDRFSKLVAGDPIRFQPISIQEFISKASKKLGGSHNEYIRYLSDRYF